eukprot:2790773-Pleurochrysis_carterae.AAC.1
MTGAWQTRTRLNGQPLRRGISPIHPPRLCGRVSCIAWARDCALGELRHCAGASCGLCLIAVRLEARMLPPLARAHSSLLLQQLQLNLRVQHHCAVMHAASTCLAATR